MSGKMEKDYAKLAPQIVAIKFPETGRPSLLKASYPLRDWIFLVCGADLGKNIHPRFIFEDSPEGQDILMGTPADDVTLEFLVGLSDEMLRAKAAQHGVKTSPKQAKKVIAFNILAALEESKNKGLTAAATGE